MDGTTLRTHDNDDHRAHFGAQQYSSGAVASYPQVRGVTLTSLSTLEIAKAAPRQNSQHICGTCAKG